MQTFILMYLAMSLIIWMFFTTLKSYTLYTVDGEQYSMRTEQFKALQKKQEKQKKKKQADELCQARPQDKSAFDGISANLFIEILLQHFKKTGRVSSKEQYRAARKFLKGLHYTSSYDLFRAIYTDPEISAQLREFLN